jgi:hypothetical protein
MPPGWKARSPLHLASKCSRQNFCSMGTILAEMFGILRGIGAGAAQRSKRLLTAVTTVSDAMKRAAMCGRFFKAIRAGASFLPQLSHC